MRVGGALGVGVRASSFGGGCQPGGRWSASRRNGKITVALCDQCLDALLDAE